jgi:hypothetical protein
MLRALVRCAEHNKCEQGSSSAKEEGPKLPQIEQHNSGASTPGYGTQPSEYREGSPCPQMIRQSDRKGH